VRHIGHSEQASEQDLHTARANKRLLAFLQKKKCQESEGNSFRHLLKILTTKMSAWKKNSSSWRFKTYFTNMGIGITVSKVLEFFFLHLLHTCLKSQHCNTKTVSQQIVLAKVINFAVNIKKLCA
jgi:hypothetical protein